MDAEPGKEAAMITRTVLFLLAGLLLLATPAHGQTVPVDTLVHYGLTAPPSEFDWGCFGPCECPVFIQAPLTGTFSLVRRGTDPATLATTYDVLDVHWSAPRLNGASDIKGAGTYVRMETNPPTDELTLDLSFDGGPLQHFDSGTRTVAATFPEIRSRISLHGEYCHDSLLIVDAKPASVAGADLHPSVASLGASPNPFSGSTSLELSQPRAGPVTLAVFDAAGRRVRTLARDEWLGAGSSTHAWDGRRDDGRDAPPGLYLARLESTGEHVVRTIVKLAP
jgi:hypothetical protein